MAKRRKPLKQDAVNGKPKDDQIRWVDVRIPIYTGELSNLDVQVQAKLTSKEQREGWQRFNKAAELIHNREQGQVMMEHQGHTRAMSLRWLFAQLVPPVPSEPPVAAE